MVGYKYRSEERLPPTHYKTELVYKNINYTPDDYVRTKTVFTCTSSRIVSIFAIDKKARSVPLISLIPSNDEICRGPGAHSLRWVSWFLTRENILRRKPMTYHRVHTHNGMTGY